MAATLTPDPPARGSIRMRPADAARDLGISLVSIYRLMAEDVFTVIAPRGRGRGKPCYLLRDEVECYAVHLEEGVRNLRAKKKRL